MKLYLQIILVFALTTMVQAASAQSSVATPRITILDAPGGLPVGTTANVFAGSDITVRLSVDLDGITAGTGASADNYLSAIDFPIRFGL